MASKIWYLDGKVNWHANEKPDKYGKYTLDLYLTPESQKKYIESGLNLKDRNDKAGAAFVKLGRKHISTNAKGISRELGPWEVLDKNGDPFSGRVGNGSDVTVKVEIYDLTNGNKGHRVEAVRVNHLVEAMKQEVDEDIDQPF